MRVCIVIGFFDLFSNYQEVCLAKELVRQGHQVHVICGTFVDRIFSDEMLQKLNLPREFPTGLQEQEGLFIHRLKPFFNRRSVVLAKGINNLLQELRSEVVICMMPGQIFSTIIRKPAGAKLYSLFADNRSQYLNLSPVIAGLKRLVFYGTKGPFYTRLIGKSDAVYASTPSGVSIIQKLAFGKQLRVLPLAFDPSVYKFDPELRASARKEAGFSDQDLVWISTGKIIPVKQMEVLIRAFKVLSEKHPRVRLVLAGATRDSYCNSLRTLIDELRLGAVMKLLDFMPAEKINRWVNAADIGVWHRRPAISIQQAMGTGIFCVLPDNDFVGHLLTPETGAYFPEEDWQGLAAVMDRLSALHPLSFQESRAARAEINQKFAQDNVVRMLLGDGNPPARAQSPVQTFQTAQ